MVATEAQARVATLERELSDLTAVYDRERAEAADELRAMATALDAAETRIAALERQQKESTPTIAARDSEIARLRAELKTQIEAKVGRANLFFYFVCSSFLLLLLLLLLLLFSLFSLFLSLSVSFYPDNTYTLTSNIHALHCTALHYTTLHTYANSDANGPD